MLTIIGARVKALRKRRGLTQEDLAKAIGVVTSYISNIERGVTKSPSTDVTVALARELGSTVEELTSAVPLCEKIEVPYGVPMRRREDHIIPERLRLVLLELNLPPHWVDEIGRLVHLVRLDNEELRMKANSA